MHSDGQTYGRYRVVSLLGEGAMGRVYLAEDPILKRLVAVKVISTDRHLAPDVLSEYLTRFAVEAQSCAQLNHPSIVSIYDAGEQEGVPWIAFEYVDGERLDTLITREGQLPFDRIAFIAGDIAAAMRHAHGLNIVHRDIKPANILIDGKSGVAKLADFGVVKAPFTAITQSGEAVGSPGYMSPEQIDNLDVDARSDVFSFGIVLYQMITGVHPFLRNTMQATLFATVRCYYTPILKLRPDTPDGLVKIVEKSLVANRDRRIVDGGKLCSMVAAYSGSGSASSGLTLTLSLPSGADVGKVSGVIATYARKVYAAAAKWSAEKIIPPANKLFDKIRRPVEKRFPKSKIAAAIAAIAALAAVIMTTVLFTTLLSRSNDGKAITDAARELGYEAKDGRQLAAMCRAYADSCDHWNAGRLADILASSKNSEYARSGRLFRAISAMCADRFTEAADLFADVLALQGGESAVRAEERRFIRYLTPWMERELPDALVFLCAQRLLLHDSQQMKVWMKDRHYWVRWNAVNILQTAGVSVDLVPVYILDLQNAASSKTKVRAAEKLGALGDKRAIPALIAARDSRSNPASYTARRVLRDKFNVW